MLLLSFVCIPCFVQKFIKVYVILNAAFIFIISPLLLAQDRFGNKRAGPIDLHIFSNVHFDGLDGHIGQI